MTRLPLTIAFAVLSLTAGAAAAADLDDNYGRAYRNNDYRYSEPASAKHRVPDNYDEDNYRPRHGGWQKPAYIRSVEARASYNSDYLPFHVQEWRARREAIENWKQIVANRYGQQFAHWRLAEDKRVDCDPRHGSVVCTVSGRPVAGGPGWGWGRRWGWNSY